MEISRRKNSHKYLYLSRELKNSMQSEIDCDTIVIVVLESISKGLKMRLMKLNIRGEMETILTTELFK